MIPDTTQIFELPHELPTQLNCFTDGSCLTPSQPRFRLATWAVCMAMPDMETFQLVASGGLCGPFQTILRAEIVAASVALQIGVLTHRGVTVWTDNLLVYNRMQAYLRGEGKRPSRMHKDHDLWTTLSLY